MKKKTRRHIKKISKTLRRAWSQVAPMLEKQGLFAGVGLGGSALMIAAARDPEVRRSAQALVIALRDFLTRSALGQQSIESDERSRKESGGRPASAARVGDEDEEGDQRATDDEAAHELGHTH